jgi:hypothetical protein
VSAVSAADVLAALYGDDLRFRSDFAEIDPALAVAAQLEGARPWAHLHPPLG